MRAAVLCCRGRARADTLVVKLCQGRVDILVVTLAPSLIVVTLAPSLIVAAPGEVCEHQSEGQNHSTPGGGQWRGRVTARLGEASGGAGSQHIIKAEHIIKGD